MELSEAARVEYVAHGLSLYLAEGQISELRVLSVGGRQALCGYFADPHEMALRALELERQGARGIYFTPNPLKRHVLTDGRGPNQGAKREDVDRRRWLLVDADPGQPPKTNATDAEKAAARAVMERALRILQDGHLFGRVVCDSSNGYHAAFPIDLPADEPGTELVKAVLRGLHLRCSDDQGAKIDTSVHDLPRIWKVPGVVSRKGEHTAERPHRQSSVLFDLCEAKSAATAEMNTEALRRLVARWEQEATSLDRFDAAFRARRDEAIDRKMLYARSALDRECQAMAATPQGGLNIQLNTSAFSLGTLCQPGLLTFDECFDALCAAAERAGCNSPAKDHATIRRGLTDGMKKPRDLSEMESADDGMQQPQDQNPTGGESPQPGGAPTIIYRASEVTPRAVQWLWPGRIPLGKLTTFAGVGGLGKTFVLCDIAARVTRGMTWPDGSAPTSGQVLFISGEDDVDDTLVPRLIECGADLDRVCFLKTETQDRFTLKDLPTLSRAIAEIGPSVRFVAIDPPTAYLGGIDDHKNSELRSLLSPLKSWAARHGLAMVFNTHVNKQAGKVEAMMRVMGSVAWVNAVRAAILFGKDSDDPERRLFVGMKNNLAKERKGLAYRIAESGPLARVEWLGEVDTTADEAVNHLDRQPKRDTKAAGWLIERFRERREWPSNELFEAAKRDGISRSAVFEAKAKLRTPACRKEYCQNGEAVWIWHVPPDWSQLSQAIDPETLEPVEPVEPVPPPTGSTGSNYAAS